MKIQPTRDIIHLVVDKPKEKTSSGLYIIEDWKTLPPTGVVQAQGPDVKGDWVGKHVLFERYTSITIGKDDRFTREVHILGEVEDDA